LRAACRSTAACSISQLARSSFAALAAGPLRHARYRLAAEEVMGPAGAAGPGCSSAAPGRGCCGSGGCGGWCAMACRRLRARLAHRRLARPAPRALGCRRPFSAAAQPAASQPPGPWGGRGRGSSAHGRAPALPQRRAQGSCSAAAARPARLAGRQTSAQTSRPGPATPAQHGRPPAAKAPGWRLDVLERLVVVQPGVGDAVVHTQLQAALRLQHLCGGSGRVQEERGASWSARSVNRAEGRPPAADRGAGSPRGCGCQGSPRESAARARSAACQRPRVELGIAAAGGPAARRPLVPSCPCVA
jgi:hypothetical protein